MRTEGRFQPASATAARERFDALGSTAQVLVREIAQAMEMDSDEYDEQVTPDVVGTARETLFAESLAVTVGTREEFEAWRADYDGEVVEFGSENVPNVAWHAPGFGDTAVAATFASKDDAAVATLRRQAMAEIYADLF